MISNQVELECKKYTNLDSEIVQSGLLKFNNSIIPFFNEIYFPANSFLKS